MTTTEEKESFGKRLYTELMRPTVSYAVFTGYFAVCAMILTALILFANYPELHEFFRFSLTGNKMIDLFEGLAVSMVLFVHCAKLSFRLSRKVKAWEKRDEEEGRA